MIRGFLLAFVLVIMPGPAYAYVDPGILSTLYQALYALAFGVAAAWIMRPWAWLKSLFPAHRRKPDVAGNEELAGDEHDD